LNSAVGIQSLHEIISDNGLRLMNSVTSKELTIKSSPLPFLDTDSTPDGTGW